MSCGQAARLRRVSVSATCPVKTRFSLQADGFGQADRVYAPHGPEPPYHAPVFVLTHHARERIEMEGGTTFYFVTDGFDAAYAQARETAGERGVDIAGGASTVRQALIAGVVDELTLNVAPVLLGSGERIFDGVESFGFEPVEVLHSPLATHIRYRRAG
jgi:dihydrofolate reductase